ncbi:MAG TPA: glycosyltransferase [Thermoanaerobaculia bacterium]|nr:glycosyltransferase [Thermoanaerobaculia bacterium]
MGRDVTVVLIAWNSAEWLARCLESLRAQSVAGGTVRLVAIDNASSDASASMIAAAEPAELIRNPVNRGFAAAANQGIAAARGDWVLFLNPDVRMERGYLEQCIQALEGAGERFGSATGTLYRAEGSEMRPLPELDSCGIRMTRSGRHLDIDDPLPPRASGAREVFGVSGAAALYRLACLRDLEIDGSIFDEDFFAYREDADLAWRARLFGWRSLHVPEAIAYHVRRVTPQVRRSLPPEINMHSVKNRFLLRMKNEGAALALRNAPWEIPRDLAVLGATLTTERSSLPAWRWLWQHRGRIARKREAVQRRRVVSDHDIAVWFR